MLATLEQFQRAGDVSGAEMHNKISKLENLIEQANVELSLKEEELLILGASIDEVKTNNSEKIWIAKLSDEPAMSEDLTNLREQAKESVLVPHMVLDFTGVERIVSTNLSQLLRLRKLTAEHDARMCLANPDDSVWAIFLTTGLDKVFEFAEDVPTALADLQIHG